MTKEQIEVKQPIDKKEVALARDAIRLTTSIFTELRVSTLGKQIPTGTQLGAIVIHGLPLPVVIVGMKEDFDKGRITYSTKEHPGYLLISTAKNTLRDREVNTNIDISSGRLFNNEYLSSNGGHMSDIFFPIIDGGYVATIGENGMLDQRYLHSEDAQATFAVIFAGMDGFLGTADPTSQYDFREAYNRFVVVEDIQ